MGARDSTQCGTLRCREREPPLRRCRLPLIQDLLSGNWNGRDRIHGLTPTGNGGVTARRRSGATWPRASRRSSSCPGRLKHVPGAEPAETRPGRGGGPDLPFRPRRPIGRRPPDAWKAAVSIGRKGGLHKSSMARSSRPMKAGRSAASGAARAGRRRLHSSNASPSFAIGAAATRAPATRCPGRRGPAIALRGECRNGPDAAGDGRTAVPRMRACLPCRHGQGCAGDLRRPWQHPPLRPGRLSGGLPPARRRRRPAGGRRTQSNRRAAAPGPSG